MFGEYGLAARQVIQSPVERLALLHVESEAYNIALGWCMHCCKQRSREGGAGKGDLVRDRRPERHAHADNPLPASYERMGLKQITMQPGDISEYHCV
eukprot:COSAG02_NODE_2663_length_8302_cov_44.083994_3_plen_97_part_00